MEVLRSLTEKGRTSLIVDGFHFRQKKMLKTGEMLWNCTNNTCPAVIRTDGDSDTVTRVTGAHSHEKDLKKTKRKVLRAEAQRRVDIDPMMKPGDLISSILQDIARRSISFLKDISQDDVKHLRNHLYNRHRRDRRKIVLETSRTPPEEQETWRVGSGRKRRDIVTDGDLEIIVKKARSGILTDTSYSSEEDTNEVDPAEISPADIGPEELKPTDIVPAEPESEEMKPTDIVPTEPESEDMKPTDIIPVETGSEEMKPIDIVPPETGPERIAETRIKTEIVDSPMRPRTIVLKKVMLKSQKEIPKPSQGAAVRGDGLPGAAVRGDALRGAAGRGDPLRAAEVRGDELPGAAIRGDVLRGAAGRGDPLRVAEVRGDELPGAAIRGDVLRGAAGRGDPLRIAEVRGDELPGAAIRGDVLRGAAGRGDPLRVAEVRGDELPGAVVPCDLPSIADGIEANNKASSTLKNSNGKRLRTLESEIKESTKINGYCEPIPSLNHSNDEDYNFFLRILPEFRRLSPSDKGMIKAQIQQLIAWKLKNIL